MVWILGLPVVLFGAVMALFAILQLMGTALVCAYRDWPRPEGKLNQSLGSRDLG